MEYVFEASDEKHKWFMIKGNVFEVGKKFKLIKDTLNLKKGEVLITKKVIMSFCGVYALMETNAGKSLCVDSEYLIPIE